MAIAVIRAFTTSGDAHMVESDPEFTRFALTRYDDRSSPSRPEVPSAELQCLSVTAANGEPAPPLVNYLLRLAIASNRRVTAYIESFNQQSLDHTSSDSFGSTGSPKPLSSSLMAGAT
jgi:hypothetical protein